MMNDSAMDKSWASGFKSFAGYASDAASIVTTITEVAGAIGTTMTALEPFAAAMMLMEPSPDPVICRCLALSQFSEFDNFISSLRKDPLERDFCERFDDIYRILRQS
jgi:hypothetical protein